MLINAITAIAPAGSGTAPVQGSALPTADARPWTGLPSSAAPCGNRTGGAMPAVALDEPVAVAFGGARLRSVQHVIDLNTPTGTTLGNHSPGRPQS